MNQSKFYITQRQINRAIQAVSRPSWQSGLPEKQTNDGCRLPMRARNSPWASRSRVTIVRPEWAIIGGFGWNLGPVSNRVLQEF